MKVVVSPDKAASSVLAISVNSPIVSPTSIEQITLTPNSFLSKPNVALFAAWVMMLLAVAV